MTAALATFALPAAALATWALIRSPLGRSVVAEPRGDRWHERQTPLLGGLGLFVGLLAGVGAALAADALEPSKELLGILGGCAIVFGAGLADDLRALPPVAKLASQVAAAALVIATGLQVQIVSNDVLATAIAVL
jgi:UDP-GlcNAc:undecaprenyl-phosphate/decaprenyl-phosphate GlcNAc-1-phosphate transferase